MEVIPIFIYKITCKKNNKIYIGKTHKTTHSRWLRHINESVNFVLDTKLARAIRKYGPDAFIVETIDEAKTAKELNEKEKYWIQYYNSNKEGYNMTPGGEGNNTYECKTEAELDEIKDKIRKTKLGSQNPHSTAVKCKNIKTNEVFHFDTVKSCCEFLQLSDKSKITKRIKSPDGQYVINNEWIVAKENESFVENYTLYKKISKMISVLITDMSSNKQILCNSYTEAADIVGLPMKTISRRLKENKSFEYNHYLIARIV